MKFLQIACCCGILVSTSFAQDLTVAESANLEKRLKDILEEANEELDAHAEKALTKLKAACVKDSAAMDLFYDAAREVSFLQEDKKPSEFLAWKSTNKKIHTSLQFRKLTSYEVRWLQLAVEARTAKDQASEKKVMSKLVDYLDEFYNSSNSDIIGDKNASSKGFMKSEMAKYLKIDQLEIKNWPLTPLDIGAIYESHILPYVRKSGNTNVIKQAWEKRFQYSKALIVAQDDQNKRGLSGGGRENNTKQMIRYLEREQPLLEWQMFVDIYNYGSQVEGANSMFNHIEENLENPNSVKWTKELLKLLTAVRKVEEE